VDRFSCRRRAVAITGRRPLNFDFKQVQCIEPDLDQVAIAYDAAVINAGLGDKELVLSWLERAYDERSPLFRKLKVDPKFDLVRTDQRFAALLQRAGLAQ
jgi:hypothetical protein